MELRRWGVQVLSRASVADAVELLTCRTQVDLETQVHGIHLPVLLIHGADDRIVPAQSSRELAALLPQAELQEMPGLGHVPIVTEPARVAALIDHFGTKAAGRQ